MKGEVGKTEEMNSINNLRSLKWEVKKKLLFLLYAIGKLEKWNKKHIRKAEISDIKEKIE